MAADGAVIIEIDGDDRKFKSALGKLGGIATGALQGVTAAVGAASAAVAGLAAGAAKVGAQFEQTMANTSTMFGDVAVDTEGLNAKILELSNSTGVAADEIGKSLYNALSAGIPVTEDMGASMEYMESCTKLAKAGFTDVDTAVTATAKILNAYKMDVSQVDNVHKILMQTQNKGITTVDELGASLAQVTPTAAAMGVGFDQVGASLASMTAQGTPTAQATTQLNSLFAELGKSGTQAQMGMEQALKGTQYAGKSFQDLMAAGVPLNEVLDLMGGYAQSNGEGMLDMFSSIEAGKAALALSGQNTQQFTDNLAAMATETDVVGDAYAKVTDTLQAKTEILKESFKNLGIAAYDGMEAPLKDVATTAIGMVGQMADAFQSGGLSGAVGALGSVFAQLVTQVANAAPKMIKLAVELLQALVQGIQENLPALATGAVGIVSGLANGIIALLPQLVDTSQELFAALVGGIGAALPMLIPAAVSMVTTLVQTMIENIPLYIDAALQLVQGLAQGLIDAIPVLLEALPALVDGLLIAILESIPLIIQAGIDLLTALVDALPEIISTIVEVLPELIDGVISALLEHLPLIIQAGIDLLTALVTALPEIITAVTDALPALISGIVDALIANIPTLIETGITLLVALIDNLPAIITGIASAIPQLVRGLADAITGNIDKIILAGVQLFVALIENLPAIIEGIVKAIPQIIDGIVKGFSDLSEDIVKIGGDLLKGIWKGINDAGDWLWEKISGFFGGVLEKIKDFFGIHSPSTVFAELGGFTMQGFAVGMKNESGKTIKTAGELSKAILAAASQWVEGKKVNNQLAARDEEAFWKELISIGGLGAKELTDATKKMYAARAAASKESFTASKNWIAQEKFYNRLSLEDEAEAWQRVADRKNLSAAEQTEAEKSLYTARQTILKQQEADEKKIYDQQEKAFEDYQKAVESRAESLQNFTGLFDKISDKSETTGVQLLTNLRGQVSAFQNWQSDMTALSERGITGALLEELQELGPKAAEQIHALTTLSDTQLTEYANLFAEKGKLAAEQAEQEIPPVKIPLVLDTEALEGELAQVLGQQEGEQGGEALTEGVAKAATGKLGSVAHAAEGLVSTFTGTITKNLALVTAAAQGVMQTICDTVLAMQSSIAETASQTVATFCQLILSRHGDFTGVGLDAMGGFNDGLYQEGLKAIETARWVADSIIREMQRALDIHSPSRKMAQLVGVPTAQGFLMGFENEMAGLHSQMQAAVEGEMGQISVSMANRAEGGSAAGITRETHTTERTIEKIARLEGDGLTGELVRMLNLRLKADDRRRGPSLTDD